MESDVTGGTDNRTMFRFHGFEQSGVPAPSLEWTGDLQPLGYSELAAALLQNKPTIPLISEARVHSIGDVRLKEPLAAMVSGLLESSFTSSAIGLVEGGWLPSALAADRNDITILRDRNIVKEIDYRFDNGKPVRSEPDFLDLFADRAVRINPILYAMESNARQIPTLELMRSQIAKATRILKSALPLAEIVFTEKSLDAALANWEATRARFQREQVFLVGLAPGLKGSIAKKKMRERWDEVLVAAKQCQLSHRSLVVLAALSSVVVSSGRQPARGVLKFDKPKEPNNYTEADAYNALFDLRALENLLYGFGMFPDKPVMLCTGDKDLALFWTGMRASDFRFDGKAVQFSLEPVPELLPEWASEDYCTVFRQG